MKSEFKKYKAKMVQGHDTVNWAALTSPQREELTNLMNFHKVPASIQKTLKYQIFKDGTVRGYIF